MRTSPRLSAVASASTALMILTACTAPTGGVEGFVDISGSSTVEPVSLIMAEDFNWLNRNWTYRVNGPGTTAGFEQFCNGETDISDASRGIKDREIEDCAEHGITADIELIRIEQINEAYERMLKGDVKYRFVIDMASLA